MLKIVYGLLVVAVAIALYLTLFTESAAADAGAVSRFGDALRSWGVC